MKVQKADNGAQYQGTITGGRKDDGGLMKFTVVWDVPDKTVTEHCLNEIEQLMSPVNEPPIVRQKIRYFESLAANVATPQAQQRRRFDRAGGISDGIAEPSNASASSMISSGTGKPSGNAYGFGSSFLSACALTRKARASTNYCTRNACSRQLSRAANIIVQEHAS